MSDSRETIVQRTSRTVQRARILSKDSLGMNLGDLRALVSAAEGLPDKVYIHFGGVSRSSTNTGVWWAKSAEVEHEVPTA